MALTLISCFTEFTVSRKPKLNENELVDEMLDDSEEDEDAWETCTDTEDEMGDGLKEFSETEIDFLSNISDDIFEGDYSDYLFKINQDIFLYEVVTSFVNNHNSNKAHWFGTQLRLAKNCQEEELHHNFGESKEDSEDKESEDDTENDQKEDLSSILHSWDWPQHLLWNSCSCGHLQEVQEALRCGASLVRRDPGREYLPALHLAVLGGSREVVELLLRVGAEVGVRGLGGKSVLEVAMERGREEMVEVLLEAVEGDIYSLVK